VAAIDVLGRIVALKLGSKSIKEPEFKDLLE